MALWSLNCGGDVDISYIETLEGEVYSFRFRWNETDESWSCYVGLQGEDPAIRFKMTNGFDLLKPYKYLDGVPKGFLLFFDTVKVNGRPDFENTGNDKRYQVYYVDSTGIDS
jgi:hypothetical protein